MCYIRLFALVLIFVTSFIPYDSAAQTPRLLLFEPPTINVDTVKSNGGVVKLEFKCKNIAKSKVVILEVRTQCGCLQPQYSARPIEVGGFATVYAELDPKDLFGALSKSLTVVATNGDYKKFNTLTVVGYIDAGVTEAQVKYPYQIIGSLRSNTGSIGMRQVKRGEVVVKKMTLYNDSDKAVALSYVKSDNTFSVVMPRTLQPAEQGEIEVRMATANMDIGIYSKNIKLSVAGLGQTKIEIKGAIN